MHIKKTYTRSCKPQYCFSFYKYVQEQTEHDIQPEIADPQAKQLYELGWESIQSGDV